MSTNPYLAWVVGARVQKDDPRFDPDVWKALEASAMYDWTRIEVPVLLAEEVDGFRDGFDLVSLRYLDEMQAGPRPTLEDLLYYGSPMSGSVERPDKLIGIKLSSCHDRHLMRGLWLLPGFRDLFKDGLCELQNRSDDWESDWEVRHVSGERKAALEAIDDHRFVEMYQPWMTKSWYAKALHVLRFVGWTGIAWSDLRMFMAFDWS